MIQTRGTPVPAHSFADVPVCESHHGNDYEEKAVSDYEREPSRERGPQGYGARVHKELVSIKNRFVDTLHPLMPGVGHRPLTLTHGQWPHAAVLEMNIRNWPEEVLLSDERCEPRRRTLFDDEGRTVHVLAQHLLDDHWRVTVAGVRPIIS